MPRKKVETYYDAFIKDDSALPVIFQQLKYLNYKDNVPFFIENFDEFKNQNLKQDHKNILYGALNIPSEKTSKLEITSNLKTKSFLFYSAFEKELEFLFEVMDYFNVNINEYISEHIKEDITELEDILKLKKGLTQALRKNDINDVQRFKLAISQRELKVKNKQELFQQYETSEQNTIAQLKILTKLKLFVPYQIKNIEISLEKYQLEKSLDMMEKPKNKSLKI